MRYILTSDGYIDEISFDNIIECKDNTCTKYTGTIPDGYTSLVEWHKTECLNNRLNAWKIVDGNLVFDENKYSDLQSQYEIEEEENSTATHKWVRNQLGKESQIVIDEFSNTISDSELVILEDSGLYEIPEIVVSGTDVTGNVDVIVSNKNLLGIENVTSTINGLTFTINEDGSITINGTSTADTEYILNGSSTNTKMLFLIKENIDYIKSGLTDNVGLNLYNFDGTDRTLISSGGNGVINLSASSIITCSSLSIESGLAFEDITIYPQIEVGSEATEFIKHEENKISGTLSDNRLTIEEELKSYDPISVVMNDRGLNIDATYFTGKAIEKTNASIEVLEDNIATSVTDIKESLNEVEEAINTINSTMLTQTAEQFEMLFTQTGVQETLNGVQELLDSQTEDMNTLTEYIRFKGASIELGRSDSLAKVIIANDRISFMNGDNESAYITENQLYITDSTILRKLQVGHWVEEEDDFNNLNLKWIES